MRNASWLCMAVCAVTVAAPALARDVTRLSGPVMVNDHIIPYSVFAIYVMPGSRIEAGFVDARGGAVLTFAGRPVDVAALTAPDRPGHEVLEIHNTASGETCRINVFTLVPASGIDTDGRLNGYRIGAYPREPLRGEAIYRPPEGFVEVTEENFDVRLSPNFTLGQFVAKQKSTFPKYLILRPGLLLKLENILASLNEAGHATESLVIMSGYRTPFYNRSIGNVRYSRHVWGGAADFYIDEAPADGRMDDLNADGRVDRADAKWLADFINGMSRRGEFGSRTGGLGVYGSTSAHGPFVHVDVRGARARW